MPTIDRTKYTRLDGSFSLVFSTKQLSNDDPVAFFAAVAETLVGFQSLDANLLSMFAPDTDAVLVIDQIDLGSLMVWLGTQIAGIPEDNLRRLDYKRILGHFLVLARKRVVAWLTTQKTIEHREQVETLAGDLEQLADRSSQNQLRVHRISEWALLDSTVRLVRAVQMLPDPETVGFVSEDDVLEIDRTIEVSASAMEEVQAAQHQSFEQTMMLVVKKPDFLGQSHWEFRDHGHTIRAKMSDQEWLAAFHRNELSLKPGDAISARVRICFAGPTPQAKESFEVLKVHRVVPSTVVQQPLLPFERV